MANEDQKARQEIRGIIPARDLPSLLQLSINIASAIQILDARTKQLEKLIERANAKEKMQNDSIKKEQRAEKQIVAVSDNDDNTEETREFPVTGNNTLIVGGSLSRLLVFNTVTNNDGSTTTTLSLANDVFGIPEVMEDGSIELWQSKTCPVARDYGAE